MNCRTTQKQLSAYVDGELDRAASALIEAHMAGCAACCRRLHELQRLGQGLAALPNVPVPPGFLADVKRKLDPRAEQPRSHSGWWLDLRWLKVPLHLTAALLLLLVMLLLNRAPSRSQLSASRASAPRDTAMASKPVPPVIVLEAPVQIMHESASEPPRASLATDGGHAKQWAAADRLKEPETLAADRLPGTGVGDRKPVEPIGPGLLAAPPVTSSPLGKLTTHTVVVTSTEPLLVRDAATQVALRLNGLASRLQTTPDGRMTFLHIEIPAARLAEFKSQFNRQHALLIDKNLTGAGPLERGVAASPSAPVKPTEPARARDGISELRKQTASRAGREGVAATKELAYGMAGGRTATNRQPGTEQPASSAVPMVIVEIQIRPPSAP